MTTIGILHPGQMGVTIGAAASKKTSVVWAGDGRSAASHKRADDGGLTDVGSIDELCRQAEVVVSICPPAAAVAVATAVAATGFDGVYLDANAISPATAKTIGEIVPSYVDGGVIGPPAEVAGTTRMYLAGPKAAELAELWSGSPLDVRALSSSGEQGAASALKMAYAGWTKGQSALLLAINTLASSAGVLEALREEWDISQPGLVARSNAVAGGASAKAWRFSGEMAEIANTMAAADLPEGFHRGAESLYERLAGFKDQPGKSLEDVIGEIRRNHPGT